MAATAVVHIKGTSIFRQVCVQGAVLGIPYATLLSICRTPA